MTHLGSISVAALHRYLEKWLPRQRWFLNTEPCASLPPRITHLSEAVMHDDSGLMLCILVAHAGHTYFVPLVVPSPDSPQPVMLDATATPAGQRALLHMALNSGLHTRPCENSEHCSPLALTGIPTHKNFAEWGHVVSARRLATEQSNTSIVYKLADGRSIIVKVIRLVHPGAHPDAEMSAFLNTCGSDIVPHYYGSARISWNVATSTPSTASTLTELYHKSNTTLTAHVLVATEFLEEAVDGWRLITGECIRNGFFSTQQITELGATTRRMHKHLATLTHTETSRDATAIRSSQLALWQQRADEALRTVAQLEKFKPSIDSLYSLAYRSEWPQLQRIHGDFHLGQVLATNLDSTTGEISWRVIDFEGEPLRPLEQRIIPDLPQRDLAGMLRSLSYAAGYAVHNGADPTAISHWENTAHTAFLAGYGCESSPLLTALLLDKALYEVVYEAHYRPSWISIPLAGIRALLE